jgi:methionyl-tRNA formyltransferase
MSLAVAGKDRLRIILCTKRDLAGALILNQVLPRLAGDDVLVLLSDKTRPVENAVPELAEMKFLERDLPVDTVFPLVDGMDADDAPMATFEGIARRFGVPVKIVTGINGPDGEALVRDFAPDLMLSARFSLIFKRNVFDIPRFGTYNVHPGALPRYAGLFAPFRCMVEGERRIGCTLHKVDDGIDTGPVVGIGWLPVDPERSLLWHVLNTYGSGLALFFEMLDMIRQGKPPAPWVQDRSQRVYGSLPDASSFATFWSKGYRLFDPKEYMEILRGFLPPGEALAFAPAVLAAENGVGAQSCCCAHA